MVNEIDKEFESFLKSVNAMIVKTPKEISVTFGYHSLRSSQEFKNFCEFLKRDTSINLVNLNLKCVEGAQDLAEVIKVNTTLTNFHIVWNNLGNEGAKALADAIKVNTTLTNFHIVWNNLGNEGAKALADAIKVNTTLTNFHIVCMNLGNEGVIALADAIKVNTTLTNFHIGWNNFDNEGAKALANAIKVNTTLTEMHLMRVGNVDIVVKAIYDAVMASKNIMYFPLGIEQRDQDIDSHLRKNKEIASELAEFILKGENFGRNKYAALLDRRHAVEKKLTELLSEKIIQGGKNPAVKAKEMVEVTIKNCQTYGFRTIGVTKNTYVKRLTPEIIGIIFSHITEGKDIPRQKNVEKIDVKWAYEHDLFTTNELIKRISKEDQATSDRTVAAPTNQVYGRFSRNYLERREIQACMCVQM